MNDDTKTLVKALLWVFVGIPAIAGAATLVIGGAIVTVSNIVEKAAFKKKIKEGLKNGTIIEHEGRYYEVDIVNAQL